MAAARRPDRALEHQLQTELRPALWTANHEAMHAGFGHRHATLRRARQATSRVDEAQARIAEIRADTAGINDVVDGLEQRARHLADVANATVTRRLDQLDQLELDGIDRALVAVRREPW